MKSTSRVELGWNAVYDVCSVNTEDGPLLVMCSWKDDSVVGVGIEGGTIDRCICVNFFRRQILKPFLESISGTNVLGNLFRIQEKGTIVLANIPRTMTFPQKCIES